MKCGPLVVSTTVSDSILVKGEDEKCDERRMGDKTSKVTEVEIDESNTQTFGDLVSHAHISNTIDICACKFPTIKYGVTKHNLFAVKKQAKFPSKNREWGIV